VLLGAVVSGIAAALVLPRSLAPPRVSVVLAQGVLGVMVGSFVGSSTLATIGAHWLPVILVCLATLGFSLVLGFVLAAVAPVDRATASVGMIAGGAAGMISISDDLGADDRLVLVMQYLRVLLIVSVMPIVAGAVFQVSGTEAAAAPVAAAELLPALLFLAVCLSAGLPLGWLARLPAGALIGPMLVAAIIGGVHQSVVHPVPELLQTAALAVIGLQVGLRFTPASLRAAGSLLPATALFVVVLLAGCALLGLLLAELADVDRLDAYLATTPGGLYVVVATAVVGKADAAFILAVQLLRTFLMLLVAPPLLRWLIAPAPAAAPR
jgi:membrane AbrB-like protein